MHLPAGLEVPPADEVQEVGKKSSGVAGVGPTRHHTASKVALADSKDSGDLGNWMCLVTYKFEFHLDCGVINLLKSAGYCLFFGRSTMRP